MEQQTYSGYITERKASKSLRSMSPSETIVESASWSQIPSWENRVEKYSESREKKYR
jgi:hypothetical protein